MAKSFMTEPIKKRESIFLLSLFWIMWKSFLKTRQAQKRDKDVSRFIKECPHILVDVWDLDPPPLISSDQDAYIREIKQQWEGNTKGMWTQAHPLVNYILDLVYPFIPKIITLTMQGHFSESGVVLQFFNALFQAFKKRSEYDSWGFVYGEDLVKTHPYKAFHYLGMILYHMYDTRLIEAIMEYCTTILLKSTKYSSYINDTAYLLWVYIWNFIREKEIYTPHIQSELMCDSTLGLTSPCISLYNIASACVIAIYTDDKVMIRKGVALFNIITTVLKKSKYAAIMYSWIVFKQIIEALDRIDITVISCADFLHVYFFEELHINMDEYSKEFKMTLGQLTSFGIWKICHFMYLDKCRALAMYENVVDLYSSFLPGIIGR